MKHFHNGLHQPVLEGHLAQQFCLLQTKLMFMLTFTLQLIKIHQEL